MYPLTIAEEELKNKVAQDFFTEFDSTQILGEIDFCVSFKRQTFFENTYFLWAEAKKGKETDIYKSFTQLILTIAKHKHHQNTSHRHFWAHLTRKKLLLSSIVK